MQHPMFQVIIIPKRQLAEAWGVGNFVRPRPATPIVVGDIPFNPIDGENKRDLARRIALARSDHALKDGSFRNTMRATNSLEVA
ncbi:MAG: hypothetical protein GOMPHAMPRED_002317 [Gomphillus americanus]|uniref:Uncharacterized protein n=1 Tax=Gomphillus americanus TaxID=1940652 RepID=A0A8H3FIG2_9LECA|nr:MAG: hypothetical protein GOMPHAMPRED_002317 [Gomphillus americanus]